MLFLLSAPSRLVVDILTPSPSLPFTGATTLPLLGVGIGLLAAGAVTLATVRRRRSPSEE